MTRLRIAVVLLIAWLVAVVVVGQWSSTLRFSPAAIFLLLASGVVLVAVPRLRQFKAAFVLAAPLVLLPAAKWVTGAPMAGAALPTTVIEAGALLATVVLARHASASMASFEEAVAHLIVGQAGERRARYGEVYREVRRARLHQRPLTVLTLGYDSWSVNQALERILQEAREAIAKRYLQARLAEVLSENIDDTNIVAWRGDYFLVVLPEVAPEALSATIQRLRRASQEKAGVAVKIGTAGLPEDAITLDGLIEKAMEDMQTDLAPAPGPLPAGSNLVLAGQTRQEPSHANVDHQ